MSTHRRSATVHLYPGEYEQRLVEVMREAEDAVRREALAGGIRFGQRSEATAAAAKFDALRDNAPEPIKSVALWQIGYLDWDDLTATHPARDAEPQDAAHGVNMSSFPRAVLHLSMVEPVDGRSLEDRLRAGDELLRSINPSRIHYLKLEAAAWGLNNEDLNLPKGSLVSLLTQTRDGDSEQRSERE